MPQLKILQVSFRLLPPIASASPSFKSPSTILSSAVLLLSMLTENWTPRRLQRKNPQLQPHWPGRNDLEVLP